MRAIPLLTLLLSGWFVVPAQADEGQDWLKRLGRAEQQSYQGTFIYERNGSFSTHEIWHRVQNGQVHERLLQLDGSAQEFVRIDGRIQCATGSFATGVDNSPGASAPKFDPQKLNAFYEIAVSGKSLVAGRSAVIVSLTPRDQYRYGFELHLDRETALPLKSLLINDKGQLLERFQFTQLKTTIPDERDLQPGSDCKPLAPSSNKTSEVADPVQPWYPQWLPPGFELTRSDARKDPKTRVVVNSLMYEDGLARFSLFLEPVTGEVAPESRVQLGPTVAVSRRMSTPQGDIVVTVVGEIPMGTAERIALSVRSGPAPEKP
ncbi:sigma factor regulatory protein [Pseudomonas fluorescens]|uniref:Sigma factor regulatory protein n=1 Tax=Pseudomonas fluorescens TaxID=294 RepID=A0A379I9T7_PSEFL|nr:MucB/RseB C-terminal domain-containing protein [Pseudomonas fluorescens]AIG05281.1 RNA polymerase sigma-H factor AlgU [Pseudomonas fluorescens]SUD29625.1 sigma factor regulatory protein [Pseudomonas fluorescens]